MLVKTTIRWAFLALVCAGAAADDARVQSGGGAATVFVSGSDAYEQPVPGLGREAREAFARGEALFHQAWLPAGAEVPGREGLGPLFNAASCASCHAHGGRSNPFDGETGALLVRINGNRRDPRTGARTPDPVYGAQIQDRAIDGVRPEARLEVQWVSLRGTFPDGEEYELRKPMVLLRDRGYGDLSDATQLSVRVAPPIFGAGLLEAVPDETIRAIARAQAESPDHAVAGRPNMVWDIRAGERRIGRFGWKAGHPTVEQQVAAAFAHDIGITSDLFPIDDVTPRQPMADRTAGPELEARRLAQVTLFNQALAVPARRDAEDPVVRRGEALFNRIGCAVCHVPELRTGAHALPELAHQLIRPFTDLLLHDMGAELSDAQAEFDANGREWRTPPLWGIGLAETVNGHLSLLHDGRARSFPEAILWHGGEAEGSARAFRSLSREEREAVVAFLRSL